MAVPLQAQLPASPHPLLANVQVLWALASQDGALPTDERQAFEARMRAAWPGVVRLVERLLAWPGSKSEVEDVAQETFLAAWKARHAFRGEAEWTTWVHSIALRRARNAARARGRRLRWFGRSESELDALQVEGHDGPRSGEDTASGDVRSVLQQLRHADREVLVLHYLEGLSVEQVATQLSLGRAAVDTRLSRARARMKSRLDDLDEAEAKR